MKSSLDNDKTTGKFSIDTDHVDESEERIHINPSNANMI